MGGRRSLGGSAVEDSLREVGFDFVPPTTALVETERPIMGRHFSVVLAQNAWNVIPFDEFRKRARPYPARVAARMLARRSLARLNLKRAERVVVLTEAMATWCEHAGLKSVEVAPVTVPTAFLAEPRTASPATAEAQPFVLIPGSVTWYKRADRALEFVAENTPYRMVTLAGPADGSGAIEEVRKIANRLSLDLETVTLSNGDLAERYVSASLVVVPSDLESLSFSLAEALWHSRRVVASRIPAHVELSRRLGREPEWIDDWSPASDDIGTRAAHLRLGRDEVLRQWTVLAGRLDLGVISTPRGPQGGRR